MTAVTTHERPGVYSVVGASAVVYGARENKVAGLVALTATASAAGKLTSVGTYAEAVEAFGKGDAVTELVRLLLANGAARVKAAPVAAASGYAAALGLLAEEEDVQVVVCDSTTAAVQEAVRASVAASSAARQERIAVLAGAKDETVSQLTARAAALNSERVVLVAPGAAGAEDGGGAMLAAAVAGAICGETDPAVPLGGAELRGLTGVTARYGESDIDTLVRGGVTPVESLGGRCTVVRGVTTRTKTGGESDTTWRELGTVLVADDVVPTIRRALAARFARAKNTAQVRSAIHTQVVVELERKKAAQIVTGYGPVTAETVEGKPTVCLVTFSFSVAHGLDQIWLSAQMTV